MKRLLACLLAAAAGGLAHGAQPGARTITFTLDLGRETVVDPTSVGLRGSQPPLDWTTTTTMARDPADGLYKATVTLTGAGDKPVEFKFVHDHVVWEKTANRQLDPQAMTTARVAARWNWDGAHEALFQTVAELDRRLFDAFNARDLDRMRPLFAPDLEFFHDKDGLSGFAENMSSFEANFKGPARLRRDLVAGTLEVFPVPGYGAMEIGAHRFCELHAGGAESCATFRFAHVWHQVGSQWQLARVLSFDH